MDIWRRHRKHKSSVCVLILPSKSLWNSDWKPLEPSKVPSSWLYYRLLLCLPKTTITSNCSVRLLMRTHPWLFNEIPPPKRKPGRRLLAYYKLRQTTQECRNMYNVGLIFGEGTENTKVLCMSYFWKYVHPQQFTHPCERNIPLPEFNVMTKHSSFYQLLCAG